MGRKLKPEKQLYITPKEKADVVLVDDSYDQNNIYDQRTSSQLFWKEAKIWGAGFGVISLFVFISSMVPQISHAVQTVLSHSSFSALLLIVLSATVFARTLFLPKAFFSSPLPLAYPVLLAFFIIPDEGQSLLTRTLLTVSKWGQMIFGG